MNLITKAKEEALKAGWKSIPTCRWIFIAEDGTLHCSYNEENYDPDHTEIPLNPCSAESCPSFVIRLKNRGTDHSILSH